MIQTAKIMRSAGLFILLAIFIICLGVLTAHRVEAAEDNTAPQLLSFDISPTQIDTSEADQEITITMRVTDDLAGVCYYNQEISYSSEECTMVGQIQVNVSPLIGTQHREAGFDWYLTSGDVLDGTYEHTVTIPKWSKSGVWQVDYAYLIDALGNIREIYTDELNSMFPNSNLTFTNTQSDTSVTIEKEWTLTSSSGNTTVVFPEDAEVTREDGGSFQFYKMVNQPYTVSNLPTTENLNGTPVAAIRFGVPGLNLSFDKPVSISMKVSAEYANQTLRIQSLEEGENEWASETSCTVRYVGESVPLLVPDYLTGTDTWAKDENGQGLYIPDPEDTDSYGLCEFTVTHASYYAAAANPYVVTGTKTGAAPVVRVFSTEGRLVSSFLAYAATMTSGINVAVGDIDGDGTNEIITSARTGGGPQVRAFDVNGNNLGWDFFAYDENFRGGVNIAIGDIEGDGPAEIITAPMANGGPNVRVFGLRGGSVVPTTENFMAYDENFRGGIAVSIGDIEGDGVGDVITTPTSRGGPHVRVFGVRNHRYVPVTLGVMAYAESFRGGINSTVGDVDGDGWDEIMTGIVSAGGPHVRILGVPALNSAVGLESPGFYAYAPEHRGGVEVTTMDVDGDGVEEIVTGVGGDGSPVVRFFNAAGEQVLDQFEAYSSNYKNGITVSSGFFEI